MRVYYEAEGSANALNTLAGRWWWPTLQFGVDYHLYRLILGGRFGFLDWREVSPRSSRHDGFLAGLSLGYDCF